MAAHHPSCPGAGHRQHASLTARIPSTSEHALRRLHASRHAMRMHARVSAIASVTGTEMPAPADPPPNPSLPPLITRPLWRPESTADTPIHPSDPHTATPLVSTPPTHPPNSPSQHHPTLSSEAADTAEPADTAHTLHPSPPLYTLRPFPHPSTSPDSLTPTMQPRPTRPTPPSQPAPIPDNPQPRSGPPRSTRSMQRRLQTLIQRIEDIAARGEGPEAMYRVVLGEERPREGLARAFMGYSLLGHAVVMCACAHAGVALTDEILTEWGHALVALLIRAPPRPMGQDEQHHVHSQQHLHPVQVPTHAAEGRNHMQHEAEAAAHPSTTTTAAADTPQSLLSIPDLACLLSLVRSMGTMRKHCGVSAMAVIMLRLQGHMRYMSPDQLILLAEDVARMDYFPYTAPAYRLGASMHRAWAASEAMHHAAMQHQLQHHHADTQPHAQQHPHPNTPLQHHLEGRQEALEGWQTPIVGSVKAAPHAPMDPTTNTYVHSQQHHTHIATKHDRSNPPMADMSAGAAHARVHGDRSGAIGTVASIPQSAPGGVDGGGEEEGTEHASSVGAIGLASQRDAPQQAVQRRPRLLRPPPAWLAEPPHTWMCEMLNCALDQIDDFTGSQACALIRSLARLDTHRWSAARRDHYPLQLEFVTTVTARMDWQPNVFELLPPMRLTPKLPAQRRDSNGNMHVPLKYFHQMWYGVASGADEAVHEGAAVLRDDSRDAQQHPDFHTGFEHQPPQPPQPPHYPQQQHSDTAAVDEPVMPLSSQPAMPLSGGPAMPLSGGPAMPLGRGPAAMHDGIAQDWSSTAGVRNGGQRSMKLFQPFHGDAIRMSLWVLLHLSIPVRKGWLLLLLASAARVSYDLTPRTLCMVFKVMAEYRCSLPPKSVVVRRLWAAVRHWWDSFPPGTLTPLLWYAHHAHVPPPTWALEGALKLSTHRAMRQLRTSNTSTHPTTSHGDQSSQPSTTHTTSSNADDGNNLGHETGPNLGHDTGLNLGQAAADSELGQRPRPALAGSVNAIQVLQLLTVAVEAGHPVPVEQVLPLACVFGQGLRRLSPPLVAHGLWALAACAPGLFAPQAVWQTSHAHGCSTAPHTFTSTAAAPAAAPLDTLDALETAQRFFQGVYQAVPMLVASGTGQQCARVAWALHAGLGFDLPQATLEPLIVRACWDLTRHQQRPITPTHVDAAPQPDGKTASAHHKLDGPHQDTPDVSSPWQLAQDAAPATDQNSRALQAAEAAMAVVMIAKLPLASVNSSMRKLARLENKQQQQQQQQQHAFDAGSDRGVHASRTSWLVHQLPELMATVYATHPEALLSVHQQLLPEYLAAMGKVRVGKGVPGEWQAQAVQLVHEQAGTLPAVALARLLSVAARQAVRGGKHAPDGKTLREPRAADGVYDYALDVKVLFQALCVRIAAAGRASAWPLPADALVDVLAACHEYEVHVDTDTFYGIAAGVAAGAGFLSGGDLARAVLLLGTMGRQLSGASGSAGVYRGEDGDGVWGVELMDEVLAVPRAVLESASEGAAQQQQQQHAQVAARTRVVSAKATGAAGTEGRGGAGRAARAAGAALYRSRPPASVQELVCSMRPDQLCTVLLGVAMSGHACSDPGWTSAYLNLIQARAVGRISAVGIRTCVTALQTMRHWPGHEFVTCIMTELDSCHRQRHLPRFDYIHLRQHLSALHAFSNPTSLTPSTTMATSMLMATPQVLTAPLPTPQSAVAAEITPFGADRSQPASSSTSSPSPSSRLLHMLYASRLNSVLLKLAHTAFAGRGQPSPVRLGARPQHLLGSTSTSMHSDRRDGVGTDQVTSELVVTGSPTGPPLHLVVQLQERFKLSLVKLARARGVNTAGRHGEGATDQVN